MGELIKNQSFKRKKVLNKNEIIHGLNDGNITELEPIKREKETSEKNPEIELFSSRIRIIVDEILGEVTDNWHKKNGLFRYFSKDGLKDIESKADILSDKMFINGLLMDERLSNTESKTYVPFSDNQKLEEIKFFLVSEFKDKIENLLNLNSNTYNNAFVINFLNK